MKRHTNKNNRRLHVLAAIIGILVIIQSIFTFDFGSLIYAPILYLVLVFCGHYFCEGDRPELSSPLKSLRCHVRMLKEIANKKI